jgi:hypothetical protein
MKLDSSKKALTQLHEYHQECIQKKSSSSLEEHINQLFTISLWSKQLISKRSLRGRVTVWLRGESNYAKTKTIKRIASALKTWEHNVDTSAQIPLSFRLSLHKFVHENSPSNNTQSLQLNTGLDTENLLPKDTHLPQQPLPATPQPPHPSFLLRYPQSSLPISQHLLNTNGDFSSVSIEICTAIGEFFKAFPQYAAADYQEQLAVICNEYTDELQRLCKLDAAKGAKKRLKYLQIEAKQLTATVHELPVGKSWSFGGPVKSKQFQKILTTILSTEASPVQWTLNAFKDNLSPFLEQLSRISGLAKDARLDLLFEDSQRNLPQEVAAHLPQFLTSHLESWFRQGAIGAFMEFVPDGDLRENCLWISENGEKFLDPKQQKQVFKELEQRLTSLVLSSLQKGEDFTESLTSNLQNVVPPSILEGIGLGSLGHTRDQLLHIEKMPSGHYCVSLYDSHSAAWRQYNNVTDDKLTPFFFERLLTFRYEPLYETGFNPSIDDLIGLCQQLEAPQHKIIDIGSKASSIFALASHPELQPARIQLECYRAWIVELCTPFLVDNQLVLSDNQYHNTLHKLVEQWLQLAHEQSASLDQQYLIDIEAMAEEIYQALAAATSIPVDNDQNEAPHLQFKALGIDIPLPFLNNLKQHLKVSSAQLSEYRDSLAWALGDEVGELIDILAAENPSTYPNIAPAPTKKPVKEPKKLPRGYLGTLLYNAYVQTTLQVLNIAWQLLMWYRSIESPITFGLATIHLASRTGVFDYLNRALEQLGIYNISSYLIPKAITEWVRQSLGALKRKCTGIVTQLILRTLFTEEGAAEVEKFTSSIRSLAKNTALTAIRRDEISYTFPADTIVNTIVEAPSAPIVDYTIDDTPYTFSVPKKSVSSNNNQLNLLLNRVSNSTPISLPWSQESTLSVLQKWHDEAIEELNEDLKQNINWGFLRQLQRCLTLPIPSSSSLTEQQNSIWDQLMLEEIEPCMQMLFDISEKLRPHQNHLMEPPKTSIKTMSFTSTLTDKASLG